MGIIVKQLDSTIETKAIQALRMRVFVDEQGISREIEIDHLDDSAIHAVAYESDTIVGTGRLILDTSTHAHIGRMAVDAPYRSIGVGSAVLAFLENCARSKGIKSVTLNAQHHAKEFYTKHGYQEQGDMFLEAGLLHVEMTKEIA